MTGDSQSVALRERVSVAIAAYTEARWDEIVAAVDSASDQVPAPIEIVLVVDHNQALLDRAEARWPYAKTDNGLPIHIVANEGSKGLSGARNTAIAKASGSVVAFLDDDAAATPGWLAALVAPYVDPNVVATGGSATPLLEAPRPSWWPPEFDWVIGCSWVGLPDREEDVRNVIGCNMSMRHSALIEAGGFAEGIGRVGARALGCEETDLCIRLLHDHPERRVVYVPSAAVSHHVPAARLRARYFVDRCYAEGLSKALVVGRVGSGHGLSSERAYVSRTLPAAVLGDLRATTRRDPSGMGRAAAIGVGLAVTGAGFVVGRCMPSRARQDLGTARERATPLTAQGVAPRTSKLRGLMQSEDEWTARNTHLFESMAGLISRYADFQLGRGLDVGCQSGTLTDKLAERTGQQWWGIDPVLTEAVSSPQGASLLPGSAERLPFDGQQFDVLMFANVFEHVDPEHRVAALTEMRRVLRPGGVIVGQLPNPYFPIESHSRLPFMGWLPISLQRRYWRLTPAPWQHDFFVVTLRGLRVAARASGLRVLYAKGYNYPLDVIPRRVRPLARALQLPMKLMPWSWQFVLARDPEHP